MSQPESDLPRAAVIACGALVGHVHDIAERRSWNVHIESIDPLLHNKPKEIVPSVENVLAELRGSYDTVAIAYADCGTYGELDQLCEREGLQRLEGDTCYDVFATTERMKAEFEQIPGTYVLTDYLVKTFRRSVVMELALDTHPELRDDYFHAYQRLLWLTQHETPELLAAAQEASHIVGLPLEIMHVGDQHLEEQLATLLGESA